MKQITIFSDKRYSQLAYRILQQHMSKCKHIIFPEPIPAMYRYKVMNLDRTISMFDCKVLVLAEHAKTYQVKLLDVIRLHCYGDIINVQKKNISFELRATASPAPSTQRPAVDCTNEWWNNN